jgi:predicted RNA binding protein YcfA (HicA-like mRNA interferase family)
MTRRRLPALSADDVVRARAGFSVHRISGSHHHLRNPDRPRARPVVPMHRGDLPTGMLRAIIRQAGLSVGNSSICCEARLC